MNTSPQNNYSHAEQNPQLPAPGDNQPSPAKNPLTAEQKDTLFETQALPLTNRLYKGAYRLTHNHADAEDLVQETMARAYQKFDQYEPGTNLLAWLYRIMNNRFLNDLRAQNSRPHLSGAEDPATREDLQATHAPLLPSAEQSALNHLPNTQIVAAFDALPPEQRVAVYLADVEELPYKDIAAALDVPLGTVMSRIYRGRAALRISLEDLAREHGIGSQHETGKDAGDTASQALKVGDEAANPPVIKRGRGRPRKHPLPENKASSADSKTAKGATKDMPQKTANSADKNTPNRKTSAPSRDGAEETK